MPPIAQQGEHARVEVVEQKSVSTPHACPAARCKHGTPDFSNREVISGQSLRIEGRSINSGLICVFEHRLWLSFYETQHHG